MHTLAITLSILSLLTLILGLFAWRYTNSKSVAFNTFLGSAGLLFSGYLVQAAREPQLTYIIPFLVFALFAGRALGFGYRSRNEVALRLPSAILGTVSAIALGAAILTFVNA